MSARYPCRLARGRFLTLAGSEKGDYSYVGASAQKTAVSNSAGEEGEDEAEEAAGE